MQHLSPNSLLQGGKYKIVRYISSGGFGCTYEGELVLLHERVAIKEFFVKDFCNRDEQTSHVTVGTQSKVELVKKLRNKFIDEAKALYKMQHPNIVRVLDVFEENGTAYYVMDYIDGQSLHEIVKKRGSLPEQEVFEYVEQIGNALKYVHGQNRLHLDIKPGNIMIDNAGVAKLIDFGASKQYDEVDGENTSTLLGKTPGYAPIEQMGNTMRTFTPATDIYALGATIYKCLTGKTPPDATLMASGEELDPMPTNISIATRNAVLKAMMMIRTDRPQTVDAFFSLLNSKSSDKSDDEATKVVGMSNLDRQLEEEKQKREAERKAAEEKARKAAEEKAAKEKREREAELDRLRKEKQEADRRRKEAEEKARREAEEAEAKKNRNILIGIVIAVILVIVLVTAFNSGSTSQPSPVPVTETSVTGKTIVLTYGHESKRNFVYTGEVNADGIPEGEGTAQYPETKSSSSATFKGTFRKGMPSKGVIQFSSKVRYDGTFDPKGNYIEGTLWDSEGYYFKGTFNNGQPYNGSWYTPNGEKDSDVRNGK